MALVRRLVASAGLARAMAVVAGGRERTDSVRRGLAALPRRGCVAVHDAARPLVTPAMLSLGLRACRRCGAVAYGRPVTDTLKLVRRTRIQGTADRAQLVAIETPQFFPLALLRRAHDSARAAGVKATDDCALVERLGTRPRWLPTPLPNIKITTPADLRVCAALL